MWLRAPARGRPIWWIAVTHDATKDITDLSHHTPILLKLLLVDKRANTMARVVFKALWQKCHKIDLFVQTIDLVCIYIFYQILKVPVFMDQRSSPELMTPYNLQCFQPIVDLVVFTHSMFTTYLLVKAENLHNNCKYYFCVLACR